VEINAFHSKAIKRNSLDEVAMRGAEQPPKLLITDVRTNELPLLKEMTLYMREGGVFLLRLYEREIKASYVKAKPRTLELEEGFECISEKS
jgi:hypothetical protein